MYAYVALPPIFFPVVKKSFGSSSPIIALGFCFNSIYSTPVDNGRDQEETS